ncbi:PH domain-containing protein [Candidatus Woesearchaeota archaeon]|nr:PH domain-containing protein [Candidatus Woesearchaeota archaeon]
MSEHETNEEVLLNFKKSRKAFVVEYACGFLLLVLAVMFQLQGWIIPKLFYNFILVASLAAFITGEVSIRKDRYKITPEKVIIVHGIIKKSKKSVHFHPLGYVPDINVHQSPLERLLGYGTIYVRGTGENQLEIKDVNNPEKVLKIIEELIEKNRAMSSKRAVH